MRWETPDIRTFPLPQDAENHLKDIPSCLSYDCHTVKQDEIECDDAKLRRSSIPATSEEDTLRPRPCQAFSSYPVADELILLPSNKSFAVSLNSSAKGVWELCNGQNSVSDIIQKLCRQYSKTSKTVQKDVTNTIDLFQQLDLLSLEPSAAVTRTPVRFVMGIEDKTYFHWQLPILLESLHHKLPMGWDMIVVVCNNHSPLSETLSDIFHTYGVRYFTTVSHPINESMDFSDGKDFYVPLNRIEALNAVADHIEPDDMVCLMETDMFLYGDLNLDIFPTTNTLAEDWLIGQELFFSDRRNQRGVKLQKLLESFDCPHTFKPGGVLLFLTGETVKNKKFIRDCFRFTQILYLMGKIHDVPKVWTAEMPCFALALTVNGIPYELTDTPEFTTRHASAPTIPWGTLYHYYRDLNDGQGGAFYHSQWYKHQYFSTNMLQENLSHYASQASSAHEEYFFELVRKAQRRLHVSHP